MKAKQSISDQIDGLDCVNEVDELLQEGTSPGDVAKFIQQTLGEITDAKESSLVKTLRARRKALGEAPIEMYNPAAESPSLPRSPSTLARGAYMKQSRGIDALIEMESTYLSIRDRIGWLLGVEQQPRGSGEHRAIRPFEKLYLDYQTAANIIEKHAKMQVELGLTPGDRLKITLDVQGLQTKFGASIASVLSDPESRHKVLSLLDRLKSAGTLPADVIDVPVSGE